MATSRLGCGSAVTLFYEPDGLLLRSCLIPVNDQHRQHQLTFQLGYLGPGDITVHIALEGGPSARGLLAADPIVTTAVLSGLDPLDENAEVSRHRIPGVRLSYVTVPDEQINYRYIIWGQAGSPEDTLRGELSTMVSGRVPELTATTRAGVTRKAIPDVDLLPSDPRCPPVDHQQAPGSCAARAPLPHARTPVPLLRG
ncbi:hypothetical protein [Streptomyces beijiangensis]|uniref:hypothetical protein n=1 Tax=Streptomyces beijiangensis TaxID=163361 RepID=UPI001F5C1762|nr:hypothetical protein [Streptomyces beijiangensis]